LVENRKIFVPNMETDLAPILGIIPLKLYRDLWY